MNLTRTAYGTWSGGRYMHFGEQLDEERYIGLMRLAYDKGIRTFVTADVYGAGRADEMLGQALKGLPRDTYSPRRHRRPRFLQRHPRAAPKATRASPSPACAARTSMWSTCQMATEKSLERCGTSKFDCLMLHNPDSIGYTSHAVWDAMARAEKQGLTDRLGIAPGPANGFTLDMIQCFEKFGELTSTGP